jgi:uncharacterized repeat protein (TIGR03803 family)
MTKINYKKNLALAIAAFLLIAGTLFASGKELTLVRFNGHNGFQSKNALTPDGNGNLYGVTSVGGNGNCNYDGCGVVFELSPAANGSWTDTVIYVFKGGTNDTGVPLTDLVFDAHGNLFGATGSNDNYGAVYELTPNSNGKWSEKIIFHFTNQGYFPGTRLGFDGQGNLYGTLVQGSTNGTVFQLSPQSNGTWKETTIHTFTNANGDGRTPDGGVVLDAKGNIYGTTVFGGTSNNGIVFELSPGATGFTETIPYTFTGQSDGGSPIAPLTFDAKGNLYGTTLEGGQAGGGVVFRLSQSGGNWSESVLYSFTGSPDGHGAFAISFDANGNLYGATQDGGGGCNSPGCGIVYKLTSKNTVPWRETILHNFESADDGSASFAGVYVDSTTGYVYGTTAYGGGRLGKGTVFEIQP